MSTKIYPGKIAFPLLVLSTIFLLIFLSQEPWDGLLLFMAFAVGVLLVFDQFFGLCLLLLIRPLIDLTSKTAILELGSFSLNFASALGLAVIASFLIVFVSRFSQIKNMPLFKQWFFFGSFAAISLLFSISPALSLSELLRITAIFATFCFGFIAGGQNVENYSKIIKTVIFSSVIPAVFAFYQFFTKTGYSLSFEDIPNRVFGTFAHPNPFAYFMALAFSLTLLFVFKKQNRQRPFALIHVALTAIAIGMTFTRGAWLLVMGMIFLIGAIRFRKLLAVSALVVFALYLAVTPFRSRINSLLNQGPSSSIAWRISLWSDSLGYALEKPVFGHGIGTAEELIMEKRGKNFGSTIPHNDFLRTALDTGILGLTAYLSLLISTILFLAKRYSLTKQENKKTALLLLSCFAFLLFFASTIDNIFEASALQMAFWATVGALLGSTNKISAPVAKEL